jgi:P-type Ca2+ transporter type 2C
VSDEESPGWRHAQSGAWPIQHQPAGLSDDEAARRLADCGANAIVPAAPSGIGRLLRAALADPMLWFLLITAGLFGALGDRVEALVLLAAIVPLFGMDAFLHGRVQSQTAALSARLAEHAEVIRDGRQRRIDASALVPGDRIRVAAGAAVPADAVLLDGDNVQVDESTLTGESLPVRKQPLPESPETTSIAHRHWLGAGTTVLTGEAVAEVIATGAATAYGTLAHAAAEAGRGATPLQQSLRRLVAVLLVVALALCVLLAVVRWWQGFGVIDALLAAVTLAVAAIPEEFPLVFASFLGLGVYRLSRRHALVRRAVAVEALGGVTCICTDKTGTLTEGRVELAHLVCATGIDEARLLRAAGTAANPAAGDPVDAAILARAGAQAAIARFPFTEGRRREVAIARDENGLFAVVKGAPETVFGLCGLPADGGADWQERLAALAADGHKLLACGERGVDDATQEPDAGYTLLGLLAFADPLRPGVREAVVAARAAGVRIIMVTGDHPATARAIAVELGLGDGAPRVQLGEMVDAADPPDVVARCLPAQKLALVQALQARGERVAVTGDGINDVPALRGADVGIAMGQRGTRAARDAAAIVLLDDAFDSIVAAIAEGRQLFRNLRAAVAFLLLVHIPLVLTAAALPLAGYPLPYTPIVIVWFELLIHPLAFLAFQQSATGTPPRSVAPARFFDARQWRGIALLGAMSTLAVGAAFIVTLEVSADIAAARAAAGALLAACVLGSAAGLSRLRGRSARGVVGVAMIAVVLSLLVPPFAALLGWRVLDGITAALVLAVFALTLWAASRLDAEASRPLTTMAGLADAPVGGR